MKKVSLNALEKDGWQIKKEDRDRVASRTSAVNLENAARSIADSIEKIAAATKDLRPTKDGAIEKTLAKQTALLVELVQNIGLLALKEPPVPVLPFEKPMSLKKWEFHVERDLNGFIETVSVKQVK